jgi:hypothetical protein
MSRKLTNDDYYQCMRVVRSAKLKGREKGVLRTYADWYYWPDQRPCIYGLDQIAAWTGISRSTATRAHDRLEELGWVQVDRFGRYDPLRVWPTVGISDPEYDLEGYAKAHRIHASSKRLLGLKHFAQGQKYLKKLYPRRKERTPLAGQAAVRAATEGSRDPHRRSKTSQGHTKYPPRPLH